MDIDINLKIVGNFEKSYDVFRRMCKANIMHKCVYTHARPNAWPVRQLYWHPQEMQQNLETYYCQYILMYGSSLIIGSESI